MDEDDQDLYYLDEEFEEELPGQEVAAKEIVRDQCNSKIKIDTKIGTSIEYQIEGLPEDDNLYDFDMEDIEWEPNKCISSSINSANISSNLVQDVQSSHIDSNTALKLPMEPVVDNSIVESITYNFPASDNKTEKNSAFSFSEEQLMTMNVPEAISSEDHSILTAVSSKILTQYDNLEEHAVADVQEISPSPSPAISSATESMKHQLQLLKKGSFRKQISKPSSQLNSESEQPESPIVTLISNEPTDVDPVEITEELPGELPEELPEEPPDEKSVEIPDEENLSIASPPMNSLPSLNPAKHQMQRTKAPGNQIKSTQPIQRYVSPHAPPRALMMVNDSQASSSVPYRRRVQQQQSHTYHQPRTSNSHESSPKAQRSHSSPNSTRAQQQSPSDSNNSPDLDDNDSHSVPEILHEIAPLQDFSSAMGIVGQMHGQPHSKPPVPRQNPERLKAYRMKRKKVEDKEARKRKPNAWGKDPKYHYDEKTGLFTTFQIDARIEARKEEMQARRQAYNNYNPLGHFDEVSDDEDLEIHNNHRKKRDEDSKWKKKLLRKENPIVLDREAIEREELRRKQEYISMQSYLNQQKGVKNSYQIFAVPKDFKGFSPPRTHKPGPPPRPPPAVPSTIDENQSVISASFSANPPAGIVPARPNHQPTNITPSIAKPPPNNGNVGIKRPPLPQAQTNGNKPIHGGRRIIDPSKQQQQQSSSDAVNGPTTSQEDAEQPREREGFGIYDKNSPHNPLVLQRKQQAEAKARAKRMKDYYRTVQRTLQQQQKELIAQRRLRKEQRDQERERLELEKEEAELLRDHNVRLSFTQQHKEEHGPEIIESLQPVEQKDLNMSKNHSLLSTNTKPSPVIGNDNETEGQAVLMIKPLPVEKETKTKNSLPNSEEIQDYTEIDLPAKEEDSLGQIDIAEFVVVDNMGDLSKAANRDAIGLIASVDTHFDNEEVSSSVDHLVTSFQSNEDGRVVGEVRLEKGNEDDGDEDDYGDDEFDDIVDSSGQLEAVIQFVSPQNLPSSVTSVAIPSERAVVLEGTAKESPQIDSAVANTTVPQDNSDQHQDEYSHETFDQESLPTELVAVVPVRVASEQPLVVINDQVKDLPEENPIKIRGFYDDESLDNESERVRLRELHAQRLRESIIFHQEHPEEALAEDAVIHDDVAEADNIAEENAGDPNLRQWDLDRVFEEIRKHHADDISIPDPADDLLDHTMSIPRPLNSIVQDSHEEVLYNSVQSAVRKEAEANESKEEDLQEQQEEIDASEYGGNDASEEEDDDDDNELSNNPARNEAESDQQQSGDYSVFNIDDYDNSVIRQHDDEEENPNDVHDANPAPASALAQNNIPEPMESDDDSRKEDNRMDVDEKNGNGKEEEGEEEEEETYGDEEFEPEPETDSPNSSMLEPEPSRTDVNKELSRETMHQASLQLQPHPPTVARVSSSSNSTTTTSNRSNSRERGSENIGSGWTQRKLRPQSRPTSTTDQPEGVNKNASVLEPSSPINQSTKPNHNASAFVDSRRNSLEDITVGAFVRLNADGVGERGGANERSGATDAPRDVPDPAKLKIVKRNSLLRASAGFSAKSFDTSSNASSSPVPPYALDAAESVFNVTNPTKHTSADSSMQKNQSISPSTIIQPAVSRIINYNDDDDDDDEGIYDFDMDFDAPVVPIVATMAAPASSQPLKHPLRQIPPSSQQDTAEPISSVILRLLNQRDEDDDALDGDDAIFGDDELFRFH